ncbi:MAG: hypothetical protein ACFFC7_27325 [Candidatus Hermodarchaeota archaeon]
MAEYEPLKVFLFGTRERAFFTLWYITILGSALLLQTFGKQAWEDYLGGSIPDVFWFSMGMVLIFSTGYWLLMSLVSFLVPGKNWPLFPPKKRSLFLSLVFNLVIFIILAIISYFLVLGRYMIVSIVAFLFWSFLSVYFIYEATKGLIFWTENIATTPKTTNPLFNIILIFVINLIFPFPVALLLGPILDNVGAFVLLFGYALLLSYFTLLSIILGVYFWFKDKTKLKYVPLFHLLSLILYIFFFLKYLYVDGQIIPSILTDWALIINFVLVLAILFLGLRKMARIVGPISDSQYKRRLNPRTLSLFLFYLTAVYFVISGLPGFVEGLKDFLDGFAQTLLLADSTLGVFVFFAPLAYLFFFLTTDFSKAPDQA